MSKYDNIVAGCDSVIYATPKFLWLESGNKKTRIGRIVSDKNTKKQMRTKVGDTIFGCCVDAIIRDNTIYEIDKPEWFAATGIGLRCRACRIIEFEGEVTPDMLIDHCKRELRKL